MAAIQRRTIPASQPRRPCTMLRCATNCAPPKGLLLHHRKGPFALRLQMNHLARLGKHQIAVLGELLEVLRAEHLRLPQFHGATPIEQLPFLGAEPFQSITGQRVGRFRRQHAGEQRQRQARAAYGRPAPSSRPRVLLADQPPVVDLLGIEEDIVQREGAQLEGILLCANPLRFGRRALRAAVRFAKKYGQCRHGFCVPLLAQPHRFISNARSLALRDAGLRATSWSSGWSGCLVRTNASPSVPNARNFCFTFRSSMDMKAITTIRPPGLSRSGPISSKRSNSPCSSFTAIRRAMKVLVAGCKRPVLGTARSTTSARCRVLRRARARTIALATFRALLSSPS